MFFHDEEGCSRPISSIVRIGPEREDKSGKFVRKTHRVDLVGDDYCDINFVEFDRICSLSGKIIPAAPGNFLIHAEAPDYRPFRCAIVAWAITSHMGIRPVTIHGVDDGVSNDFILEMPDGQVSVCDDVYPSFDAYIKSRNKSTDV